VLQTGDFVLFARAPADASRLESQGNLFDIRNNELRLPINQSSHG
jgi:hypothetical protein